MKAVYREFLIIFCLCLAVLLGQSLYSAKADLPSGIVEGSYAQYEQAYSSGEIHELFWNITEVNESIITVTVQSHGIYRNQTSGDLSVVPGGGTMLVALQGWTIIQFILKNGSTLPVTPSGAKIPFWIPQSTTENTLINTKYDMGVLPTSESLSLSCLSSSRECWVTKNTYSPGNTMRRWYDKETGIVLKISTEIAFMSSNISVLETLNATNIGALAESTSESSPGFQGLPILMALFIPSSLIRSFHKRNNGK